MDRGTSASGSAILRAVITTSSRESAVTSAPAPSLAAAIRSDSAILARRLKISAPRNLAVSPQSFKLPALIGNVALHVRADGAKSRVLVKRHPKGIQCQRVPPILVVGFLEGISQLDECCILFAIEHQDGRSESNRVYRSELRLVCIIPGGRRATHIKAFLHSTGRGEQLREKDGGPKIYVANLHETVPAQIM